MGISSFFWNRIAKNYDRTEEKTAQSRGQALELAKKYLNASDILLDFGCGIGTIAAALAGNVRNIIGIDISAKMIALAKKRAEESGIKNIEFQRGTLYDPRLEKETFDVVVASGILHLVRNPGKAAQRIHAILKPGGWFISITPCVGEVERVALTMNRILFLPGLIGITPTFRVPRIDNLEQTISAAGFEIAERRTLAFGTDNDMRYMVARFVAARRLQNAI